MSKQDLSGQSGEAAKVGRGNLVAHVADALRDRILSGYYPSGAKLPSEARLTDTYGVSRTVIREAVASLRSDGLVEPRQGAGVFVLDVDAAKLPPFHIVDREKISSVIEMIELRAAVEIEAAGLACLRRSPAQEDRIREIHRAFADKAREGLPTTDSDFEFHLAIADATSNPRFQEFLKLLGRNFIPRAALKADQREETSPDYLDQIVDEHRAILAAISEQNEEAGRQAMRRHLKGSQQRYRALLD